MARKPKESVYFGIFPKDSDRATSYLRIYAVSVQAAINGARKHYPECDSVIPEKDFDPEEYDTEEMKIRIEYWGDDF